MKRVWNEWKKIAEKIGNFQTTILFSLLYFVLITPIGLVSSLFRDFFKLRTSPEWDATEDNSDSLEKLKMQ